MSGIIAIILIIASALVFLMSIVVTLCVFAMCGYAEKAMKTLAAMESLMRHGK